MDVSSRQLTHPAYRLKRALSNCMTRPDLDLQCFVSRLSIDECWPKNPEDLKDLLGLVLWKRKSDKALLAILHEKCRVVASILAWGEHDDFPNTLRKLCLDILKKSEQGGRALLEDTHLKLKRTECEAIFGLKEGRTFFQDQFIFLPITIRTDLDYIPNINPSSRWPWDPSTRERIGSGAYGQVFRVDIAAGQLQPPPTGFVTQGGTVAYKQVQKPRDWSKEVKNLNILRDSLRKHDHLTLHYGALTQDQDFYIFFPYTPLGDLEVFLREGTRLDDDSADVLIYKFAEVFGKFQALDLVKEFCHIIDATAFLHEQVFPANSTRMYCVHSDLRPQNILVFPGDFQRNPVGIWRISDFGISSFKMEDHHRSDESMSAQYHSVGDVFKERWNASGSLSTSLRPPGTYVGPEREFKRVSQLKASDVWSLGCIFAEVLVFSLESGNEGRMKGELDTFRTERSKIQGSFVDRNRYFYDFKPSIWPPVDIEFEMTFKRRGKVGEWLKLISAGPFSWYRKLAFVVHQMLQPDPYSRYTAIEAYNSANAICAQHSANTPRTQEVPNTPFTDFDDTMVHAKEWRVLAVRSSDDNSNDSLILKQQLGSPIDEPLLARQSIEQDHVNRFNESILSQPRPRELVELSSTQHTQETQARIVKPGFYFKSDGNLFRPAKAVKVSGSCGMILYLCKKSQSYKSPLSRPWNMGKTNAKTTYELRFRKPWQRISDFVADESSTYRLPDSGNIDWGELRVDGQCAIVTGSNARSGAKGVHVYNFVDRSEISLPQDGPAARMHKIVASSHGSFAAYDDTRLAFWRSGEPPTVQEVSPSLDASGQAVFGNTGGFLFTWSCKYERDVLHIWKTESLYEPQICATRYIPRPGDQGPLEMFLIPCGSLAACIIRDGRGRWFTASLQSQKVSEHKHVAQQRLFGSDLPNKRALYIATERFLFFISQNQEICVCNLIWSNDHALMLERQPEPLAKVTTKWPDSIGLYRNEAGDNELVICEKSGAMETKEIEF